MSVWTLEETWSGEELEYQRRRRLFWEGNGAGGRHLNRQAQAAARRAVGGGRGLVWSVDVGKVGAELTTGTGAPKSEGGRTDCSPYGGCRLRRAGARLGDFAATDRRRRRTDR